MIWAADQDVLYPVDLHSREFVPGTSLIAKVDGEPAGFLFGFYKFGGTRLPHPWFNRYRRDLCIESQLMGVDVRHQGEHIGLNLKRTQLQRTRDQGIDVITWTFDPLQYANARLNFVRLGGFCSDFYPNWYKYDAATLQSQVSASRLSVTWLVGSKRVRDVLAIPDSTHVELDMPSDVVRLNNGPELTVEPNGALRIAMEIPSNWTGLQNDASQRRTALRWRETSDDILGRWLGIDEGKYVLTNAARDGDRRYLIAERVDSAVLQRLGA